MNNLSIYSNIIKTRVLRELDYQKEFLTSDYNSNKPFVLAAGTSSGKTFMAIMKLEIFYSYIENKYKRTLIIPYSMKVLRDNFSTELAGFNPSFSYCVATTKEELALCLKSDCQVVVALPQALANSIDLLPKFNNFILDEAHQWYGKKTINDIIKKIKPKYQLLLTGTPSRFIANGDKFQFQFVPVMHLFGLNQVTNVRVEVVSSTYDFRQSDYKGTYGNLKSGKITKKDTDEALISVCKEMLKRIKNPIKQPNASRVTKNVLSVFNQIGKTIIFCHSLKQANAIYKSLNGFDELTGKVLISHSENDSDSENFIKFKDNNSYSILVAVDRGKLGFNIPELFNVVDFTLTQSLNMLMQMYGRLLRLSKTDNPKTYYKVATKNTASYYVDLMTAMLCLTNMEWYSKYNGKNMGGILIPKVLTNTKRNTKSNNPTSVKKTAKPTVSLVDLDIPLDMNLFKTAYHNDNDKFGTIAWTTLDDCRREFFEITNIQYSKEELFNLVQNAKKATDIKNRNGADIDMNIFKKLCISSGNYYNYNGEQYFYDITKHILNQKESKWTLELAKKEAKKYKSIGEAQKKDASLVHWVNKNNLRDVVFAHCFLRIQWTKDRIMKTAFKYDKKLEFQKKEPQASKAAKRLNILDDVCAHMEKKTYWTKEMIQNIIKKNGFTHKIQLRRFNSGAYMKGKAIGILDNLKSGRVQ